VGHRDDEKAGASSLLSQAEGAGLVQLGEKDSGRVHCDLSVLKGSL